ncbi:PPOX class probable F420-dependent enzyme [Nocardioides salarius]|uniref:PPOX class probable F420-dependent enzyme n=1 Tax=Nocardioides salarius TaxID=374513 RepID=A0ABS2M721_9ACTN|nr:PPOX class F420-dependent oxidoreductase [Nocardioides salarius]MBM7506984.1 PPOX class probable F420-dependent enzyme [Nocardioides salarius]
MTTAEQLAAEKYLAFTTFRRSGEPVTTPVWVVPVSDGRLGFWTAMGTGKTKRLRHDPRVRVEPGDARGRTQEATSPVDGQAEMVRSGAFFDEVQGRVREKYGWMTTVTRLLARLGPQGRRGLGYADTVVLVRLD